MPVFLTWAKSCWPWKMLASMKTTSSGILGRDGMSIPRTFTLNFLLQSHMETVNTRSWSFSSMVSCSWVPGKNKRYQNVLQVVHINNRSFCLSSNRLPATPVQSSTWAQSSLRTRSWSGSGGVSRTRCISSPFFRHWRIQLKFCSGFSPYRYSSLCRHTVKRLLYNHCHTVIINTCWETSL